MTFASIQCTGFASTPDAQQAVTGHVLIIESAQSTWYECTEIGNYGMLPFSSFDPSELDPALILGSIGAGFFALLPLWVAVYGGRAIINSIRG